MNQTDELAPSFSQAALRKLDDILGMTQQSRTAEPEPVQIRSWGEVWRVPLRAADLYLKIVPPLFAHEIPLTQRLADWFPELLPRLLSTNTERGWLLMHDSGTPLRTRLKQTGDWTLWQKPLEQMAQLQIASIPSVSEILAVKPFDWRLAQLPQCYETLLRAEYEIISVRENFGMNEFARFRELQSQYTAGCRRLTDYGLPETLHHDDFHCQNIYLDADHIVFADWGESGVGHPFFTAQISLRMASYILHLPEDAPQIDQLRDTYLNVWTDFLPLAELQTAFALAERVHRVARAYTWFHIASQVNQAARLDMLSSVRDWLIDYLAAASMP